MDKDRKLQKSTIVTALAIILVLAFTLSTATFAWFSSSQRATVNITEFVAETAGDTALTLEWYGLTIEGSTGISMDPPQIMSPMAPDAKPVAYTGDNQASATKLSTFLDAYHRALLGGDNGNEFTTDGIDTDPYRTQFTPKDSATTYKYMKLTAGGNITDNIYVTGEFIDNSKGSGAHLEGNEKRMRVSVFQYVKALDNNSTMEDADFVYIGTLGDSSATDAAHKKIANGPITAGLTANQYLANSADWETEGSVTFVLKKTSGITLGENQSIYIACLVWYDGHLLTDTSGAGGTASVTLTFAVANTVG